MFKCKAFKGLCAGVVAFCMSASIAAPAFGYSGLKDNTQVQQELTFVDGERRMKAAGKAYAVKMGTENYGSVLGLAALTQKILPEKPIGEVLEYLQFHGLEKGKGIKMTTDGGEARFVFDLI